MAGANNLNAVIEYKQPDRSTDQIIPVSGEGNFVLKVKRLSCNASTVCRKCRKGRTSDFFRDTFGRGRTSKGIAEVAPMVRWHKLAWCKTTVRIRVKAQKVE